jgi:hypothetical protein
LSCIDFLRELGQHYFTENFVSLSQYLTAGVANTLTADRLADSASVSSEADPPTLMASVSWTSGSDAEVEETPSLPDPDISISTNASPVCAT